MPKKSVVNLTRLKELMKKKGWGYGELATYSGLGYDTVYSLAKARRPNSNIGTLKPIAAALEVSVDYLLGESDDDSPPEGVLPQPVRHLVEIAGTLPPARQVELARIASVLAELEREHTDASLEQDLQTLENLLDSVERQLGWDVRVELEKLARSKGLMVEPAP